MPITAKTVTLRGTFRKGITLDQDLTAYITLSLPHFIHDQDDHEIRTPQDLKIDATQLAAGVLLAATDDDTVTPQSWYYLLSESWSSRKNVPVVLPSTAPDGVVLYDSLVNVGSEDYPFLMPPVVRSVNDVLPDPVTGNIDLETGTGGEGGPPSGPAGGALNGTYPNPGLVPSAVAAAAGVSQRARPRGPWATNTVYEQNDIVEYRRSVDPVGANTTYRCHTAHTSAATFDFGKFSDWGLSAVRGDLRYFPHAWAANTSYAADQPALRPNDNVLIQARSALTTGATYDETNWRVLGALPAAAEQPPEVPRDVTVTSPAWYQPALTEANYRIRLANGSLMLPAHPLIPVPLGTVWPLEHVSSTQVGVLPGAGVTIRSPYTNLTRAQFSTLRASKTGTHSYTLSGDLATSVPAPSVSASISATMSASTHTIDNVRLFGFDVSGYTGDAGDVRSAGVIRDHTDALEAGNYRLAFKWDAVSGKPLNGASSGQNGPGGAADWVDAINAIKLSGARIVGIIAGDTDMSASPTDAVNIVNYAFANNWGITDWIIGNEPELAGTAKVNYLGEPTVTGAKAGETFVRLGAPMKAAQPTIKLWGPASSAYSGQVQVNPANATSPGARTQFMNDWLGASVSGVGTVAGLVDVIAWHTYASGNPGVDVSTSAIMGRAVDPYSQVLSAKNTWIPNSVAAGVITSGRAATLKYAVTEANMFYRPNNGTTGRPGGGLLKDDKNQQVEDRAIMAEGSVFAALVFRNMCRITDAFLTWFADIVGPLGLFTRDNYDLAAVPPKLGDRMAWPDGTTHYYPHGKPAGTRMPSYFGIGMFTGMSLFRRFGANVCASTGTTNVQTVASTALDGATGDIVICHTDESVARRLTVTTTGITSGPVDVWQTNRFAPWDAPVKVATTSISGSSFTVDCPPMTVTRCVINP